MASNELLEPHSTQKIVLLGASDVGKSSLVLRFVKGKFFDRRENTIGAAFLTKTITLDEIRLKFEIWDTAGQERYHSLAPMYYRDAAGSLVVYDINDKESFEKAKRWLNELYKAGSSNMVIVLVGNKHDLPEREVDFEEGQKFAEEHGLAFFETSAKTNHNVEEVFDVLGRQLLEKNPPTDEKEDDDLIQIGGKSHSQQSDKGCPC